MNAEAQARAVGTGPRRFERVEVELFVHLRSAGRGAELDELTALAEREFGARLGMVGAFAEIEAGLQDGDAGAACALRTRPSEIIVWSTCSAGRSQSAKATQTLARCQAAARGSALLHVVDGSHGQAAFLFDGDVAGPLLQRLADATSLPPKPGTARRLRLADLHATLAWRSDGSHVAIVDALYADFLAERGAYAAAFITPTR
ncbi:MAG: hypothetical protein KGL43_00645 [Burkholderiales bacterium]|nr:hypothetical protein [Burkholderiales bacterium]MDE2452074.1 hypothetical protein [Burkholderiales bacterium]